MMAADRHMLPAGGALAVDREAFSAEISARLAAHPLVEIAREEVAGLPPAEWDNVIIATGPLTSPALAEAVSHLTGEADLAFFDAIAPIVYRETINMSVAWFQSRYDKRGARRHRQGLHQLPDEPGPVSWRSSTTCSAAEKSDFKEWEASTPYFDGCLPIEVMAERGRETLRHGPMKPRGLTNAHRPETKPFAVVQLRQDNRLGTLYNMVGFQTKLKHAEQVRVLRTVPGLENAEFARLGGLHRNTFLNAPRVLDPRLRLRAQPRLRFAGQITGVEGYVESAAMGLIAGRLASADRLGTPFNLPPPTTAHGALLNHITGGHIETTDHATASFQPMNVNFGLFPPVAIPQSADGKRMKGPAKQMARKRAYTSRAMSEFRDWLGHAGATAEAAE